MNELADVTAQTHAVLWGGFIIGLVLGAVAQASRFCTMGALADWFAYGGTGRLSMWLLAIAVAMLGTQALLAAGVFDGTRSLPWSPRLLWLSSPIGGLLFGFGMTLAGGCPQRALVKAGSGNLKAWTVLLIAGVAGEMTLRGLLAVPRVNLLDRFDWTFPHSQDLGAITEALASVPAGAARGVLSALFALAVIVWLVKNRSGMEPLHWLGGLVVGALVPAAWAVTGALGHLPEHPETLEPAWLATVGNRPEGISFSAPVAHTLDLLTLWSDTNTRLTFGIALLLGVPLGSAISAWKRGEMHIEAFRSPRDLGEHAIGATLMGFGGITALGCSIGQGLTGVAMLSLGAVLTTAGIVVGTWAGVRYQERNA